MEQPYTVLLKKIVPRLVKNEQRKPGFYFFYTITCLLRNTFFSFLENFFLFVVVFFIKISHDDMSKILQKK